MITKEHINIIFSAFYARAALRDDTDMRKVADLFESIRGQIDLSNPFEWWDFIICDPGFNNDINVELLIHLKENYYRFLYENIITNLHTVYESDEEEGTRLWYELAARSAIHLKEDLLCMLCNTAKKWNKKNTPVEKYVNAVRLIQQGRWADVYPLYTEIAADEQLPNKVRGYAEIILMQIILFHYPEYSRASKHLENAAALLESHFMVTRARAQYFLKTGETQKARDTFLNVIAEKPGDYFSFNGVGDCFAADQMTENAESWYKEAIQKNFIQTESYQSLISLYGDKKWFKKKEPEYEALLRSIEKRPRYLYAKDFITQDLALPGCFNDTTLYQSYRNVGAAWYANDDLVTSELWYQKAGKLQPDFPATIIDIAYLKIYQNNFEEARAAFSKALDTDQDNFDAYWGLAYLYEKLNNNEEAVATYKTCLKLRPHWSDVINNLIGKIFYLNNEHHIAEGYFREAINANGDYIIYKQNLADAMQSQAAILAKDNKNSDAEKLYLEAAAIANDDIRWNVAGNYYFGIQNWEKAIENYNKAISLKDNVSVYYENRGLAYENSNEAKEAEASYKEAIKYDDQSGKYFNRLGVFYYNQKDYEQSVNYYLQALEKNPDETVYLDNISLAYLQMNQEDKAEEYYFKILEKEPENDKILNRLGVLYFKRNEYEKALLYYDKAIAQNDKTPVYFANKAILYRAVGKNADAIQSFEKSLELNPENDIDWNDSGVIYFNEGNYDKAIEYYNKAIALQPKISLYRENLALAYEKKGLLTEAIEHYNKALEINPQNAKVLNAIGVIYYNWQQADEAIVHYKKALALESTNWIYQTNLGLALRMNGRNEEAIESYKNALKIYDQDYLNWNELGVLLFDNGRHEEAIDAYKKSINLQPNEAVLYMNLALALNAVGKSAEALKVTEGYPVTDDVKQEVESMMQKHLPSLMDNNI